MVYINSNKKLADLLEKFINNEANSTDLLDAKDLLNELRSGRSNLSLLDEEEIENRLYKIDARLL